MILTTSVSIVSSDACCENESVIFQDCLIIFLLYIEFGEIKILEFIGKL